jgi:glycosyltransferase involved in cell wall biosynthesis
MAKKAKLCIYSGSLNNKTFIKMFSGLKNSVNIQHSDASYYNRRNEKWKLNLSKTIVCYTNNDNTFISNVIKKKKLHGFNIVPIIIPLDLKPLPKKQNKICKLIYFGRIVKGKGIYFLLKMLSHLNYDIHFYGFIPNYFKFPKKYEKYKSLFFGKYNNKDLPNIIKQYNYTITATNAEGFCIALAESMACSTPIILKNTFQNADFLIDKGKNGFFYDKKASPKKAAKQINAYIENNDWQKTSKNCYEFAKK